MIKCDVMKKQGGKVRIQVAIDEKVALKARELGLNFSKILENALKDYIRLLEGSDCQNKGGFGTVGSEWWTGRDLNPRPPECESGVHTS